MLNIIGYEAPVLSGIVCYRTIGLILLSFSLFLSLPPLSYVGDYLCEQYSCSSNNLTDCTYGIEECHFPSNVLGETPGVICQAIYIVNIMTKKLHLYSKGCSQYDLCQDYIDEGSGSFLNWTNQSLSTYVLQ